MGCGSSLSNTPVQEINHHRRKSPASKVRKQSAVTSSSLSSPSRESRDRKQSAKRHRRHSKADDTPVEHLFTDTQDEEVKPDADKTTQEFHQTSGVGVVLNGKQTVQDSKPSDGNVLPGVIPRQYESTIVKSRVSEENGEVNSAPNEIDQHEIFEQTKGEGNLEVNIVQTQRNQHGVFDQTCGKDNAREVESAASGPVGNVALLDIATSRSQTADKHKKIIEVDWSMKPGSTVVFFTPDLAGEEKPKYTISDVVEHNREAKWSHWFLYARRVFSAETLKECVYDTLQENVKEIDPDGIYGYDVDDKDFLSFYAIYILSDFNVPREEVALALRSSYIGDLKLPSTEEYIDSVKEDADGLKSDLAELNDKPDSLNDCLDLLTRWLQQYPNVPQYNSPPSASGDWNEAEFRVPSTIAFDPLLLRMWVGSWQLFNTEVPQEGAWSMYQVEKIDLGDPHEIFVEHVKWMKGTEPELDMTIEGEAAWDVIPLDLVKNDITTPEQDEIWKRRENRKDLDDPVRMAKRRMEIVEYFLRTYAEKLHWNSSKMEPFLVFADIMMQNAKDLESLCSES